MKPYSDYRSSGVEWLGEVPKHWKVRPFRRALRESLKYGANEAAELDDPDLPRFIRITDIDDGGRLRDETFRSLPVSVAEPYLLEPGDLLFARSGSVGRTFLYDESWGACAYAGYLIRARVDHIQAMPEFVSYFSESHAYASWLRTVAIQATIENISAERYAGMWLPLPPLNEQRTIVAFLDCETERIDALVAKMRLLIARLQEYRTALITRTVTRGLPPDVARAAGLDPSPRLKPSGVEWLGHVPEHWEVIENRRLFTERDERSDDGEGELLTVSHITGVTRRSEKPGVGMFMAESLEGYKTCYTGDFVINTMWAWMGATGTAREAGLVSPSYNVYTPDPRKLLQRFVDLAYRSVRYVLGMTSESRGIWTSRLRLYPQQFLSLVTAIPPLEEQQAIISHVDQIESESLRIIEAVEAAIERLQEYRTALITAAVTGKVDVREPVSADSS